MNPSLTGNERRRIVVLNSKGGSGKSTLATNLAARFATSGHPTALMDFDPQGSSMRWLSNRPQDRARIHGVAAHKQDMQVTRSWQLRVPPETRYLIVDTPAAIPPHLLPDYTRDADAILIPVGPSDVDIHAASRFIADLLLKAKVSRRAGNIGVIANRVRTRTVASSNLMRFLYRLAIPVVGVLRDTQNYVHAVQGGLGLHELRRHQTRKDLAQWEPLLAWLDARLTMPKARSVERTAALAGQSPAARSSTIVPFKR